MNFINLRTPAKINISLDVTGVRENGYHDVAMVMHSVDLMDEITVTLFEQLPPGITVKTDKYYIPTDERNTAYKAAKLMADTFPHKPSRIRIDIEKHIPVAAGLAGGSSNAAGVIMCLNCFWKLGLSLNEMCEIGSKIGADVPFSLMACAHRAPAMHVDGGSACALAEGIGEILTPLPSLDFWVVMAKPALGVSTKKVYKALDSVSGYIHPDTDSVISGIKNNDIETIKKSTGNVLEAVTLRDYPEVAELKAFMEKNTDGCTLMSGSGPTVISLFSDRDKACDAVAAVRKAFAGKKNGRKYEFFCVRGL